MGDIRMKISKTSLNRGKQQKSFGALAKDRNKTSLLKGLQVCLSAYLQQNKTQVLRNQKFVSLKRRTDFLFLFLSISYITDVEYIYIYTCCSFHR